MANPKETLWIYCNLCKRKTRHILVASSAYDYRDGADPGEPSEWGEYRLWSCAGCDTCTMEDYYTADYMTMPPRDDSEEGDQQYESIYHPKRASTIRPRKYFFRVPARLSRLYVEVISSYNENLRLLCAAGLRSLVDGVCADKLITGRSLEEKIDGMKKLLPEGIVKNLHGFRFIGNRAVHELEAPDESELALALDVIEDILNFLYSLDYKASLLGKLKAAQGEVRPTILASPAKAIPTGNAAEAPNESPADSSD